MDEKSGNEKNENGNWNEKTLEEMAFFKKPVSRH
jgi:hypothetical protein